MFRLSSIICLVLVVWSHGCAQEATPTTGLVSIVVNAKTSVDGVAKLKGHAMSGTSAIPIEITFGKAVSIPPNRHFGIFAPAEVPLSIHLDALDSGNDTIASGDLKTDVVGGQRLDRVMLLVGVPGKQNYCSNGIWDPDEADNDCGGVCVSKCANGQRCRGMLDCGSGICTNGRCVNRCAGWMGFPGPPKVYANTSPVAVAAGDFDGDADDDLVVANELRGGIGLLMNKGNGVFESPVEIRTARLPFTVTVGDLNADRLPDIVVGHLGGEIGLLYNQGNAKFISDKISIRPSDGIGIGDVDGDGMLDLVTVRYAENEIGVLWGQSKFQSELVIETGDGPTAIALADYDGDSLIDIAVANHESSDVFLFLEVAGQRSTRVLSSGGQAPSSIVSGDFDNDGDADIVVVTELDGSMYLLKNKGMGVFDAPVLLKSDPVQVALTAADVNGDGWLDVLAVNSLSDYVLALMAPVKVVQGKSVEVARYSTGKYPRAAVIRDLNGDRWPDAAIVNGADASVNLLLTNNAPSFVSKRELSSQMNHFEIPLTGAVADINADGMDDLVVGMYGVSEISVLLNRTEGFATMERRDYKIDARPVAIATGDLDGDHALDVVVVGESRGKEGSKVYVFSGGMGQSGADFASPVQFMAGAGASAVAIADVNGDGLADFVVVNRTDHTLSIFLGGRGRLFREKLLTLDGAPATVALGDLNGDRIAEIVVARVYDQQVDIYQYSTRGDVFVRDGRVTTAAYPVSLEIGDLNFDGKADIVSANSSDNSITVLRNDGALLFSGRNDIRVGKLPSDVRLVDVNGDGVLDITVANSGSDSIGLIENRGDLEFVSRGEFVSGRGTRVLLDGQFNKDSWIDFVVMNALDNEISLLAGKCW